jgi:hypothetical protein
MFPFENQFPKARSYRFSLPAERPSLVRETIAYNDFHFSERHLQCVWFDTAYRPSNLMTTDGEPLWVSNPGRWNVEAGPDFLDATLIIGKERRTLQGDVEIHIRAEDWNNHGHTQDPRYQSVVLHVTYASGTLAPEHLPPGAVQLSIKDALDKAPGFYFENVDTTAYPYAVPPSLANNQQAVLAAQSPDDHVQLLIAAGQERLRRKTEMLANSIQERGRDEAFYEAVMVTLGYKNNRVPFRQLARLVSLQVLQEYDTVRDAYATLLGVSSLLPDVIDDEWDNASRDFVRSLWDSWWKCKSGWERRIMPRGAWHLAGLRPHNHPVRRLIAAAELFTGESSLDERILSSDTGNPQLWIREIGQLLEPPVSIPYWEKRLGFGGKPSNSPISIVGASRRAAIISNVIIPFVATQGRDVSPLLPFLPVEASNQLIRQTAHLLFGPDHNPALYAGGVLQQGLIQIFHDFCLSNRLDEFVELFSQQHQATSSSR